MEYSRGAYSRERTDIPWDVMADVLRERGGLGTVSAIGLPGLVADATTKFMICGTRGQPSAVLLCSPAVAANAVADAMERAASARALLGPLLGSVVVTPLALGVHQGLSYAILPYYHRLSDNRLMWRIQRRSVRSAVLGWLRRVMEATALAVPDERIQEAVLAPLRALQDATFLDSGVRRAARSAIGRLEARRWRPRYVLAHNDLWKGNILLKRASRFWCPLTSLDERFVIIDWGGARTRGYAIYDLVRFAKSTSLPWSVFAEEVGAHCRILRCGTMDAACYLLASLGAIGMCLECFPVERYAATVKECWDWMGQLAAKLR